MLETKLPRGIHGTRILAKFYAEVMLRKKGILPPINQRPSRRNYWTDAEFDNAVAALIHGASYEEIAQALNRPVNGVTIKLRGIL